MPSPPTNSSANQHPPGLANHPEQFAGRLTASHLQTDDVVSLGDIYSTDSRYYTFAIRGQRAYPSHISCVYVEHEDHLHILIKCNGNVGGKIDRVLRDCNVPPGDWYQAKLTKILVNNPVKIIRYFKFHNEPIIIGNDLRDIWGITDHFPALESAYQCCGIQLRTQTKIALNNRISNRTNKYKTLHEELLRRGVRDFKDIFTIFTVDEIMQFNASIGLQWREITK
ncbi:unnamed protein product [Hymenolepis diminuta]|uniref:LRAT domain-containing protein n=1 Tax=Hymenolepis diminuta TaxID=6216 RepID=A0A0R3SM33_HYMDI|nr:unnamed protein product [Hymenolepis diminuta]